MTISAEQNKYGNMGWETDLELFAQVATNPNQWLGSAGEHMYAAQLLLPYEMERQNYIKKLMDIKKSARVPPSVVGNYFFLIALSIENSFKAVISIQLKGSIESEVLSRKGLPKALLGHNLVELAARAEYSLLIDEEYAFRFLTRYGIWDGKYPLPVRHEKYSPTDQLSDGDYYLVGGYSSENIPKFLTYCQTVYEWAREKVNKATNQS